MHFFLQYTILFLYYKVHLCLTLTLCYYILEILHSFNICKQIVWRLKQSHLFSSDELKHCWRTYRDRSAINPDSAGSRDCRAVVPRDRQRSSAASATQRFKRRSKRSRRPHSERAGRPTVPRRRRRKHFTFPNTPVYTNSCFLVARNTIWSTSQCPLITF